jgi:hypothetical protein
MKEKTPQKMSPPLINDDSTIQEIAAALGLKASDWRMDFPEVTFSDKETSPINQPDELLEDRLLNPTEIIDELQRLGQTVSAAHHATQVCVNELQVALRLVSGRETASRGGWRVKGLPANIPSPAENAERIAMLLGQAFTIVTSLPSLCEGEKGYDVAALGRVEASLERLSDSPETFKDVALSEPAKTKTTEARTINH